MRQETGMHEMIRVVGVSGAYERKIRTALEFYPFWVIQAARVNYIEITNREDVRKQVAMYEHGTRILYIHSKVGDLLLKAIGHELAHACDDIFGMNHYFSTMSKWLIIHRNQGFFDIQKYRDEPLEYFADMMVKFFIIGEQSLFTTNPNEVNFIRNTVLPTLYKAVQAKQFEIPEKM